MPYFLGTLKKSIASYRCTAIILTEHYAYYHWHCLTFKISFRFIFSSFVLNTTLLVKKKVFLYGRDSIRRRSNEFKYTYIFVFKLANAIMGFWLLRISSDKRKVNLFGLKLAKLFRSFDKL